MLPGKRHTPEDVLHILRRRFWVLLVPFAVVSALTALVVRYLPDRYRAETLILVVPQRVPESYVRSTVVSRIEDRLHSISQQILSRTALERIIQNFNLYEKERRGGIMEDVVEQMRKDIQVQVVKGDAFRIAYTGDSPRTVQKVTERLASLFIDENLRDRELLADNTNQFLEAQLEDARRRLADQEKKLEVYRKQHQGTLPSQLESNLQVVQNTQLQIQALVESLNRDRDRRLMVQRQLADLSVDQDALTRQASAAEPPPAQSTSDGIPGATAAEQLDNARKVLRALELRLKPEHPDIVRVKRTIAELEKKAEAEALAAPVTAVAKLTPAEMMRQNRIAELQAESEQLGREITRKEQAEKKLRDLVSQYQARIEAAPTRESEMTELMRDYATIQTFYTNLLAKKEESRVAANLEKRQIGEQFKLLDPARVPEKPVSPNRPLLTAIGIVVGLGIGIGLVALLEYRDSSFRSDEEVLTLLTLPVLAVVPLMRSAAERRWFARRRLMMGVSLGSLVMACVAIVVYTFVR